MKLLDKNKHIGEGFKDFQNILLEHFFLKEDKSIWQIDKWTKDNLGEGLSAVVDGGNFFNKAGVNYSRIQGESLPASSVGSNGQFESKPFYATGVSVVCHPDNPNIPTAHLNVRYFCVFEGETILSEWFGGGFDLTPYFPFEEDYLLWHQHAKAACDSANKSYYEKFKKNCDDYFYLPHRKEHRGIGGIFYEQLNFSDYKKGLNFSQKVTNAFINAYIKIIEKRESLTFDHRDKEFQKFRRSRYVEFNLLHDRGTLFGLQSGGRIESILMSLPTDVSWRYRYEDKLTNKEKQIYKYIKSTKDWC